MTKQGMQDNSKPGQTTAAKRTFQRYFPLFVIFWILFVLYPNPAKLVLSVQRVFNLDVDPGAVAFLVDDILIDPVAVEKAVLARIPYRYDWELYSVPWYFPAIEEVLERGEGDCKARALVLASVFEAKNIPYQVNVSPIHIWVDYEGKEETSIENVQVKFYQQDPETGERRFQIPDIGLGEVMDSIWRGFWNPMPDGRKALLISGLLALVAVRVILYRNRTAGQ